MTGSSWGARRGASRSLIVALPFLREPAVDDDRLDAPTEAEERRLALVEERDRALAALKELEFDHRTGKIGDEDYRALVGPLRRAARRQALAARSDAGAGVAGRRAAGRDDVAGRMRPQE